MSFKFYDGHIYNKKDIWTDQFIEEHKDEIDWAKLLKKVMLTEEQIEKYSDYIIWKNVFLYQPVSEEFIEKYIDKLENFDWICAHRTLSIEFAKKYKKKIHWNFIAQNTLSREFLNTFGYEINWQLYTINHCYEWDETFMREFKDLIDWQMLLIRKEISKDLKRELAFSFFKKEKDRQYILRWIGNTMKDSEWSEWKLNLDDKKGLLQYSLHHNYKLTEDIIIANPHYFSVHYLQLRSNNHTNKLRNFVEKYSMVFDQTYDK